MHHGGLARSDWIVQLGTFSVVVCKCKAHPCRPPSTVRLLYVTGIGLKKGVPEKNYYLITLYPPCKQEIRFSVAARQNLQPLMVSMQRQNDECEKSMLPKIACNCVQVSARIYFTYACRDVPCLPCRYVRLRATKSMLDPWGLKFK